MAGTVRRARRGHRALALRLERLEGRTLPSAAPAPVAIDPATSLMVGFRANATALGIKTALAAVGGSIVERFPDGTDVVALRSGINPAAAAGRLSAYRAIAYAEPDGTIQAADVTPNDPDYSLQWGLNNADNVDIDAPQAWSITTGNPATIVAVLDTGLAVNDPEFTGRLWVNPTAGHDGYSGDVNGWNFVNNNANIGDNNGHGTHVTGILAATGNNSYGVDGVNWYAQIMPLKILAADGSGSVNTAVSAIMFAVNHGARVINASWGGSQYSQAMLNAIGYAASKGCVFVTAAGNDGLNNDTTSGEYPANYRVSNELVVAAVDASGNLASFSDYAAHTVDLGAPGVDVFSTIPGGFATYSGTSMATPFVSGVVSLLAGQDPALSAADLVQRVLATVKPLPSLTGTTISGGMVDAYNALTSNQTIEAETLGSTPTSGARQNLGAVTGSILATDATFQAFGGTSSTYVAGLFQAIFSRDPNPAEMSYYAGELDGGIPRQNVIDELTGFDEARRTEVARWYQQELGWGGSLADLKINSGVEYWAGLLDTGVNDVDVHAMVLASGIAPGGSPNDFVSGLYQAALGRDTDPTGLAAYVGQIQQGVSLYDVALSLLGSYEASRTEIARLYQNALGWDSPLAILKVDSGVEYWAGLIGGWS